MVDFTKTITETVTVYGPDIAPLWDIGLFDCCTWDNSDSNLLRKTLFLGTPYDFGDITGSDSYFKSLSHLITLGAITPAFECGPEYVGDGSGVWLYTWPGRTADADSRVSTTWTSAAVGSDPWSAVAATSTTWTEA